MAVRSCRVTVQDLEGVAHTVEVTAESLYEAVAQGLAALRRSDWVAGFQQGIVKVSVADVRVERQVKWRILPNGLRERMRRHQKRWFSANGCERYSECQHDDSTHAAWVGRRLSQPGTIGLTNGSPKRSASNDRRHFSVVQPRYRKRHLRN